MSSVLSKDLMTFTFDAFNFPNGRNVKVLENVPGHRDVLLGWEYELGYTGRSRMEELRLARRSYRSAARLGHLVGQFYYAWFCELAIGGDKNVKEAFEYYSQAARNTMLFFQTPFFRELKGEALNNLGACFYDGTGTFKSLEMAMRCFQEAIDLGCETARENLAICVRGNIDLQSALDTPPLLLQQNLELKSRQEEKKQKDEHEQKSRQEQRTQQTPPVQQEQQTQLAQQDQKIKTEILKRYNHSPERNLQFLAFLTKHCGYEPSDTFRSQCLDILENLLKTSFKYQKRMKLTIIHFHFNRKTDEIRKLDNALRLMINRDEILEMFESSSLNQILKMPIMDTSKLRR